MVHGIAKSWTRLSVHTHTQSIFLNLELPKYNRAFFLQKQFPKWPQDGNHTTRTSLEMPLFFSVCGCLCVRERKREEKEREGERESHLLGLVSMLSLCFSRFPLFPLTPANPYYFTVFLKKEHSMAWKRTFL